MNLLVCPNWNQNFKQLKTRSNDSIIAQYRGLTFFMIHLTLKE